MKTVLLTLPWGLLLIVVEAAEASQEGVHPSLTSLVFQLINFLVFFWVLYKLALPRAKNFFSERAQKIQQSLAEAEEVKKEAEKRLKESEEKLKALNRDIEKIQSLMKQEGELEKEKIIKEAKKAAEIIKNQAKRIVEQEIKRAKQELKKELVRLSLEKAEKIIKDNLNESDQDRLVKDYIKEVTPQAC